ncbi:MAG: 50S ribosome-binding GTPase [Armatimonadetes bacterium]|nr:50S ribosome-binding GTPase [Armatimonadota bacterium]
MPANLTPDYRAAEERFRQAESIPEKIVALEEMMAVIPKHKGTEHMQADIRRRLAKLRQEAREKKAHGDRFAFTQIERQGAGQVAVIGYPNVGKSALLSATTHAHSTVADYPFTTQIPIPGMMDYEDVQIQLIDAPPMTADLMESWMPDIIRRADAVLLVVSLGSDDCLEQAEGVIERLHRIKIILCDRAPEMEKREALFVYRPALVIANQEDREGASERLLLVEELCRDRFPVVPVSAVDPDQLSQFRKAVWNMLDMIRVYGKEPGHPADMNSPFVLKRGSTVLDLATRIHKGLLAEYPYARIWGSARFPGQNVDRDYRLQDGDVVELHR